MASWTRERRRTLAAVGGCGAGRSFSSAQTLFDAFCTLRRFAIVIEMDGHEGFSGEWANPT